MAKTFATNQPNIDDPNADDYSSGATAGFGGIAGAIPGANVLSPGITAMLANLDETRQRDIALRNANSLDLPEFAQGPYGKAAYAGDFNPSVLGPLDETEAQQAQIDPAQLEAQRRAIDKLASYGEGAASAGLDSDRREALYDAQNMAHGRDEQLAQESQARGMGGGAQEMALRQRANSAAADREQGGELQAARDAANMRLQSQNAYVNGLTGMRGQDQSLAEHNVDRLNAFNQANAALRNQVKTANWGAGNNAALGNRDARQGNINVNTGIGNSSIDRNDRNAMSGFNAEKAKMDAVNAILLGKAKQADDSNEDASKAGKEGYSNFKDLMTMGAGGMGGGMGGM